MTDWTIGFVFSGFAVVVGIETAIDAHATIMTVLEIFGSPHTTESTIRTVIRPFIVGHPEIANVAVIFTKLDATLDAIVSVKNQNS